MFADSKKKEKRADKNARQRRGGVNIAAATGKDAWRWLTDKVRASSHVA